MQVSDFRLQQIDQLMTLIGECTILNRANRFCERVGRIERIAEDLSNLDFDRDDPAPFIDWLIGLVVTLREGAKDGQQTDN